ncbi:MAG: nicotinate (nicotinamide) nucleotide adenylyltransferase [Saprospiraceae bacterium]
MKIGLFFGSFNPVHTGHLIIANFILQYTDLQKIWMVLSPQNPFKKKESLARDYERLHLLNLAIDDNPLLMTSPVEFGLKKPSYTIDTLVHLNEKHPEHKFSLIMGGDNLNSLPRWKNGDIIIEKYQIYVYKRAEYELGELKNDPNVTIVEAPLLGISATLIRKMMKEKKSIQYMVPDTVFRYLEGSNIYK